MLSHCLVKARNSCVLKGEGGTLGGCGASASRRAGGRGASAPPGASLRGRGQPVPGSVGGGTEFTGRPPAPRPGSRGRSAGKEPAPGWAPATGSGAGPATCSAATALGVGMGTPGTGRQLTSEPGRAQGEAEPGGGILPPAAGPEPPGGFRVAGSLRRGFTRTHAAYGDTRVCAHTCISILANYFPIESVCPGTQMP